MLAALALLVPPLIWVYTRKKVLGGVMSREGCVFTYLCAVLGLNWLMMLVLYFGFGNREGLLDKLNTYNLFACKYIALAVAAAVLEPFCERFARQNISLQLTLPQQIGWPKPRHIRLCACIYAAILFAANFIRIFDNNFWGDEAYTINLVRGSVPQIISGTAVDVHPPLYYLLVKLACVIAGEHGWVYHLVSLIPCALLIVFALTAVWQTFGGPAALVLITCACLSPNAVTYNVEVRMYSWGLLFILLGFYCLYNILRRGKTADYALFVLFTLAAAYTHYYCLVAVAFFYLALLAWALYKKTGMPQALACCVAAAMSYLPWFFVLLRSMMARVDNYWITTIPSFKESIQYLFSSRFPRWMWLLAAAFLAAALVAETGVLRISKGPAGRYTAALDITGAQCTSLLALFAAGLASIVGTITVGIAISNLIRPFYLLRYIYPVSVLAWLLLGIAISRLKGRRLYAVVLLLLMLRMFGPAYKSKYTGEKAANTTLAATLAATEQIDADDVILTDMNHINWTIAGYYYPGVECVLISLDELPALEPGVTYWLIVSKWAELGDTLARLEQQHFTGEQVVADGNLGTHDVAVYKLEYAAQGR